MAHAPRILLSEFNAGHGTKFASRAAFYKAAGIIDRRRAAPLGPLGRLGRRGAILRERGALAGLK
jgi:hypothetical protein